MSARSDWHRCRRWLTAIAATASLFGGATPTSAATGKTAATAATAKPAATAKAAATPTLAIVLEPRQVRPGDAFLVRVRAEGAHQGEGAQQAEGAVGAQQVEQVTGTAAGRALTFFPVGGGAAAFGALPLETPSGPLPIEVAAGGATVTAVLQVEAPTFPHRQLQVDEKFVKPPPPEIQARIEEDRAAFARAFAQPPAAPLFSNPFVTPRKARITAGYGEERTFNSVRPSQHYGQDLAGKVGEPVVAANTGEVVLARDCWGSGRSVVLWHGAGVFTTYFHLSKVLVKPGDRVARGQRIGLVGQTGRVSGPHLHWGVRIGDLYVDPASLLRLSRITSKIAR